nr:MAG TPA: MAEBL protein [Caudoviricetes sp.]
MNIKGGALEFDIIANNGQINSALEETKKRVQGFSDATVEGGAKMEAAYQEAAATIENAFKEIDIMAALHNTAINDLEKEYSRLGTAAAAAFMKGTAKGDEEYRALIQKQQAVKNEITTRKELLKEIESTADALAKEETHLTETQQKTEQNAATHKKLTTQIREMQEQLALMEQSGQRGTQEYEALRTEAGRLTDALGDARTQAKILADDNAGLQGVVSAISGVTGAFSVAQGTVALFAGENENLQKIMLKVQSLMSITIGLQQVANTLNKDSYFRIVLLGGIKKWWAGVVAQANITENANTIATVANTAAQQAQAIATTEAAAAEGVNTIATGAQTAAATAGTVANIGLAGAFRLVGTAIKSIPVIGWILAGISALVALVSHFTSKAREAKKAQQELNEKIAEMAGKPISTIEELAYKWNQLGGDLEAKKKFIEENSTKFKELGAAVNNVKDAENLLVANKDKFIEAQIAKAKAMAATSMAADLAKKAIENQQKLEEAQKTPKVTRYVSGGQFGPGYSYEIANPQIAKYEKERDNINGQMRKLYETAAQSDAEGSAKLKEAGIKGVEEYEAGTIGALEATITKKQEALKKLSDPEEYKKAAKEIENLQKQVDNITGKEEKEKPKTTTDPYAEMLEKRKKQYTQYYKWVNSKDEIIQKAAKTEFAGLLAEGNSYLEYLKKQRDKLLEVAKRSPEQNKKLSKLNDEIANETKNTVLSEFEKELQNQMKGARSIMEMLNILEEKRKTLAGDGSEVDNGKKEILDKEQENVGKKAESDTKGLLDKYSAYLSEKLNFDINYLENKRLLTENLAKATTEEERRIALAALKGLEKDKEKYSKQTGNSDYDGLVEEYKSYQQKCADIASDYDEKIAIASENKNEELVTKLTEAKNKALSSAALEELQNSGAWENLFGNLDDLTTQQIESLIAKVEAQRLQLGIELDPKDLEVVFSNLEKAKNELRERNPFKALRNAIKDYNKEVDDTKKKDALKDIFKGAASSIQLVSSSFDAAVNGLNNMGLAGDDVTQQLLGDIGEMVGSAGQLAEGIATMNPVSMIQGGIGLISSAFNVFNVHDRKAERAIQKHAAAVKDLETAYKALEHSVKSALGETVYDNQKALINNMRQQQAHLAEMAREEEGKKKSDGDKVKEYREQYAELGRQIEDTIAEIAQSITQTTAKDLANQLADALVEAYGKGEDAATAFEEVSRQVMQNAVKNALKLQFLEKPLQNAIKQLQRDMGFDNEGNGSFDGLTQSEQNRFKNAVAAIGANFAEAMKMYEGLFKELEDAGDPTTSLSGAIKGASQESIDLLAGQTNAVRVNQVESIEILRQQLVYLELISSRIGTSNRHLESIDNKIGKDYDPLRSQGLI